MNRSSEEDVDDIMYSYIFRRKMGRLTRDVTVAGDVTKVNVLLVIVHLMTIMMIDVMTVIDELMTIIIVLVKIGEQSQLTSCHRSPDDNYGDGNDD